MIDRWSVLGLGVVFLCAPLAAQETGGGGAARAAPFALASVHFEQNATDGDVEVVFEVKGGDQGLARLVVVSPDGRTVVDFTAPDSSTLGMRQFRFESPEPRAVESLKAAYPEGVYTFSAVTASGDRLEGMSTLSHALPAPATIRQPEPDAEGVAVEDLEITWTSVENLAAHILYIEQHELGYELTVRLPGTVTQFAVPDGQLRPATEYQLGIGTVGPDGNVSFVEATFTTADTVGAALVAAGAPGEPERPAPPAAPAGAPEGGGEEGEEEAPMARPELQAGALDASVSLDGVLSEPVWLTVDSITNLTTVEPEEGGVPEGRTVIRVLVNAAEIVIAARCYDPEPRRIVSFSRARDSELDEEDHIAIILDTFQDGRTGYVFAVNPDGARFDGIVSAQGEEVNSNWDAVWEARTTRDDQGWTAEIRIPVKSIGFRKGLTSWGYNIQRRVQRLQETSRWSGASQDYDVLQTSRAGLLTELPAFELGLGLSIRPSIISDVNRPAPEAAQDIAGDASVDVSQRVGPNLLASLTINTDFAETEVDARQTNLSRFEVLFPEKRAFFLEGSDIFEFGLGLDEANLVPFFSRRLGLVQPEDGESQKIPIVTGAKLNGRLGETNVGALIVRTDRATLDAVGVPGATMAAVRVAQNVLDESTIGMIATVGDPLGRGGSALAGVDATYRTSEFRGDKNLLVGVWGLRNDRDDLAGDKNAYGLRIDYPNDLLGLGLTSITIGDAVQPSLGFAPRIGVRLWEAGVDFNPRPQWGLVRQMFHELGVVVYTDLKNRWESFEIKINPLDWQFESGDRFTFKIFPQGDRPPEDFEVYESPVETVTIPAGTHAWTRFQLTAQAAEKRRVSGELVYELGRFYDGDLTTIEGSVRINPWPILSLELAGERNRGTLPGGNFTQYLIGGRAEVKPSADFQVSSFVQYDNESRSLGTNTRARWTFHPLGDLFVVYNHNMLRTVGTLDTPRHAERLVFESYQFLVKVAYGVRF